MELCPANFRSSEPKEPKTYYGWSYEGRKCPKHKVKLVKEEHECCGCCCSGCEPKYTCPKCEKAYDAAYQKWHNKWGHVVAISSYLNVKNGRIMTMSPDLRYMQFLHGGKPLKIGQWCKLGDDGFIKFSKEPGSPNMLVIG